MARHINGLFGLCSFFVVVSLFCSTAMVGQTATSSLRGTVTDKFGASVPDAKDYVTSPDIGVTGHKAIMKELTNSLRSDLPYLSQLQLRLRHSSKWACAPCGGSAHERYHTGTGQRRPPLKWSARRDAQHHGCNSDAFNQSQIASLPFEAETLWRF